MKTNKLLFIDATNRSDSRTLLLANAYLDKYRDDYLIEHLMLNESDIKPLTAANLAQRSIYNETHDFAHPMYELAKQLLQADLILIAAPYYDLSFPSILKVYIENIMCNNLTFFYQDDGKVKGCLKAKRFVYITTSGGYINDEDHGYTYLKAIFKMLGVNKSERISAEGLDIDEKTATKNLTIALKKLA